MLDQIRAELDRGREAADNLRNVCISKFDLDQNKG